MIVFFELNRVAEVLADELLSKLPWCLWLHLTLEFMCLVSVAFWHIVCALFSLCGIS